MSPLMAGTLMQLEVWNDSLKEYVTWAEVNGGGDEPRNLSGPLKLQVTRISPGHTIQPK